MEHLQRTFTGIVNRRSVFNGINQGLGDVVR
jgi:hypothetical protein